MCVFLMKGQVACAVMAQRVSLNSVSISSIRAHREFSSHCEKRVKEVLLQVAAVLQSLVKALPGLVQDLMAMLVF